ncbi:MAG: NAD(P)-dependent oxidoreductase [Oscillibacter sp.]|nr:NAD(P)-dependent oxidoreductase [Oscillibacter sp.]
MNGLIGYSGFVGQNLDGPQFDLRFNSKNSVALRGKKFDLLVCAGVPGHKTLANQFPQKDWEAILELMTNLLHVQCAKLILISTIDILPEGSEKYEDAPLSEDCMSAYALHRFKMERFVQEHFDDVTIVRLPGIFGKGLRKNFIFDLIFKIPKMFSKQEFLNLQSVCSKEEAMLLSNCYHVDQNGMFSLQTNLREDLLSQLRTIMEMHQCTSLRFTDSRNVYAYYDLSWLKDDLRRILQHRIPIIHMATEPMTAAELAEKAFHIPFTNEDRGKAPLVSYAKSKYDSLWNGFDGYLYSKRQVIEQLIRFDKTEILY